jgi:hypothetical protein
LVVAALFVGLLVASSSGGSAAPAAKKGLVASYGFNEAASKGLKFGDFSGRRNGATGHGVRRVKGKFGKGLYFNGKSSWLTVPDHATLDLQGRMTLEAWVKPQAGSGRRTILAKLGRGSNAYALNAATHGGGAGGVAGIGGTKKVTAPDDLPLGKWTHIALTYDGSALRLFFNGAEVSETAVQGKMTTSGGPLRIGGNFIGGGWFKGIIDEVRIYSRPLATNEIQRDMRRSAGPRAAPSPAPTPAPAAGTPGPFSFGIVSTRALGHIDDVHKLGAHITRIEFQIGADTGSMEEFVGRAAQQGIEVILLAGFEGRIPSTQEAQSLGAWAKRFGLGGTFWNGRSDGAYAVRYIEFGNETSYRHQGTFEDGGDYARRAKDAIDAIKAANPRVGVLVQADDANISPSPWVKDMFAAVPNLGNLAAGWTVHPYGPRARWEPRIAHTISQTAAAGSPPLPLFITEWGIASDNGRQLDDNYEWPTGMSYADAGGAVTREIADMNARFPGRLATLLWYFIRDHAAPGSSSGREDYFGALKEDSSDKGALTAAIRAAAARYPAH